MSVPDENGVELTIIFTVDNREEFGGESWPEVSELRKLISSFGCGLIQNRKGRCEEKSHLERSHRTDGDEFYMTGAMLVKSDADPLDEA
jgi:putative transposase